MGWQEGLVWNDIGESLREDEGIDWVLVLWGVFNGIGFVLYCTCFWIHVRRCEREIPELKFKTESQYGMIYSLSFASSLVLECNLQASWRG